MKKGNKGKYKAQRRSIMAYEDKQRSFFFVLGAITTIIIFLFVNYVL